MEESHAYCLEVGLRGCGSEAGDEAVSDKWTFRYCEWSVVVTGIKRIINNQFYIMHITDRINQIIR